MIQPANLPAIIAAFSKHALRRLETCERPQPRTPGWQTVVERDATAALAKLTIVASAEPAHKDRAAPWGTPMLAWLERAPVTLFSAATIAVPKAAAKLFAPMKKRFIAALERQQRIDQVLIA